MMKPAGEVHELVIAIEEDDLTTTYPIPPPPKAHVPTSQDPAAPSFRLQAPTPPLAERPPTPVSLHVSCPSPTSASPSRAASPTSVESGPRSHTSSPTLVRNGSTASTGTYSPVMRSMFPRFDPTVPLARQQYYPTVDVSPEVAAATSRVDIRSYSPSLYSQQEQSFRREETDTQRTGLTNGLGPKNVLNQSESPKEVACISTPIELVDVWAFANGQETSGAAREYKLELSCEDLDAGAEIICFDSSTSQSLYTLSASGMELSISRSHPTNSTTTMQISSPTLQTPNLSSPLIATIFPKLAELMAIDKSSTVAVEHGLDRQTCTDLQIKAIEQAHRQEASSLLWDGESQKYYLIHPTLLEDGSPAAFPIEVASTGGTPREIKILAPNSPLPALELSFETLALDIHMEIMRSYSSLYLIDTLLSTALVLLLHFHRTRSSSPSLRPTSPAPSALPFFEPPPTTPSPLKAKPKKVRPLTSWSKSFFTRQKSESQSTEKRKLSRDDDQESATITVQGSPDLSSVTAKLPHPPTHKFQIVDPADDKLPRTTRAVLRVLYWGFECLIWALGVLVNLLAMCVVGLAKLIRIL
ncbi:MAG: hypothetical protein L6R38_006592 [Xanthoria sp. 2 TBL-2021]|nr:MAG: hypothetical protein L6R38_006592 [Xanthoria sp. 2 TBL-2021]